MAPPPSSESSQTIQAEARALTAGSAFNTGHFRSLGAVSKAYNVPRTTLIRRIKGVPCKADTTPSRTLLSRSEQDGLVEDILGAPTLWPTRQRTREPQADVHASILRTQALFSPTERVIAKEAF